METQTYANHRVRPAMWLTGALASIVAFCLILRELLQSATLVNVALLLLAYAAVTGMLCVRRFAVRLQDRIIRLEMQTRLGRLGREAELAHLSLGQIVALRFASDAELPALLQRAVAEKLTTDQIKRAVTSWQPDHMRT